MVQSHGLPACAEILSKAKRGAREAVVLYESMQTLLTGCNKKSGGAAYVVAAFPDILPLRFFLLLHFSRRKLVVPSIGCFVIDKAGNIAYVISGRSGLTSLKQHPFWDVVWC